MVEPKHILGETYGQKPTYSFFNKRTTIDSPVPDATEVYDKNSVDEYEKSIISALNAGIDVSTP